MVSIRGEHDLKTASKLREQLAAATAEGLAVVVDLSDATFIDSSILGTLIDARQQAHERDQGFALLFGDGAEPVRRVLEVTGLEETFPVHADREAAIREARSGTPEEER